jgi:mycothiol synthase
MEVPAGFTCRPLVPPDAAAVAALAAAQDICDLGEAMLDEADIAGEWSRPSFDISTCTVGVFDGDRLVAYAQFSADDRGDAAVHPDYRGRGIGTELAYWTQATARAHGACVIGSPVATGSPGERLLRELGYQPRWTSWLLQLPESREITPQPLPPGYAVRQATSADHGAVWTVIEEAFLEWNDRERHDYADFSAVVFERAGFEPWNIRVATGPDAAVVGAAHVILEDTCAYVARLAVERAHRHRGLARALLVDAFAAGRGRGATVFDLNTDSRTGALSLYQKVGMRVTHEWHNYAIGLT